MQMYVNYYTREMMNEGDNLPIGIVLCADKSESVVRQELQREYHVLDDVMQNETGDK